VACCNATWLTSVSIFNLYSQGRSIMGGIEVFEKGIELYRSVAEGKKPDFVDKKLGETTIHLPEGDYVLTTKRNTFSIAAPDGEAMHFTYGEADVTIRMVDSNSKDVFQFNWDFNDPQAYKGKFLDDGGNEEVSGNHNTFWLSVNDLVKKRKEKKQASQSQAGKLYHFLVWQSLSDDFNFEVTRRIAACLPTTYFVAHRRARATNLIGCGTACWMCAIALAAVPGTPDDFFWCGLCLACAGTGFIV
jgi:hypothetical protein